MIGGSAIVFHFGESLEAPPSVKGEWMLDIVAMSQCQNLPSFNGEMKLTISQSGSKLNLWLNSEEQFLLAGLLEGEAIKAASKGRNGYPALLLDARIDLETDPNWMDALIYTDGCGNPLVITGSRTQSGPRNMSTH
jgi:hypothetical protein